MPSATDSDVGQSGVRVAGNRPPVVFPRRARRLLRRVGLPAIAVATGAALGIGIYIGATGHGSRPPWRVRIEQTVARRFAWPVDTLAFSPNGMLLTAAGVRTMSEYNLATAKRVFTVHPPGSAYFYSAAFSPDGRVLAVTTEGAAAAQLRDAATGKLEAVLPRSRNYIFYSAVFSPDGKILAASGGATIDVWNTRTRLIMATISYANSGISSLAFSPDGQTLAIADGLLTDGHGRAYGDIHLWNLANRTTSATFHDPGGQAIFSIGYSTDGKIHMEYRHRPPHRYPCRP